MNNQEIVAKLWNLCNVLRDDGITYHQYVTELTYILVLKMCKETGTEDTIPEEYRWDSLLSKSGLELKKFFNTSGLVYKDLGLKDKLPTMSREEQLDLLASNGMLVKRPIVVTEDAVLVGFKEKDWEKLLQK